MGSDCALVLAGQLDDVADQGGHLLELGVHVGEQLGPVRLGQVLDPEQHLDVGAQAGERGAQLVAGVRDELGLLLPGRGQGARAWR